MTEVVDVLNEVRDASREVEKAADSLYHKIRAFTGHVDEQGEWVEGVGPRYRAALDTALIEIYERAISDGQRPPAEDIRTALAVRRVREAEPALCVDHMRLEADIQALRQWISNRKAAINAKQSVLKGERP